MSKINSNERFVRWQNTLRQHFTSLNNLLLTISIGVVGFSLALLNNNHFIPEHCEKFFFTTGLILTFLSIIIGIGTGLSRLIDFKLTVRKIKTDITKSSFGEVEELKELMKVYGKVSWYLFYTQIALLGFGIVSLLIAFTVIYGEKLF